MQEAKQIEVKDTDTKSASNSAKEETKSKKKGRSKLKFRLTCLGIIAVVISLCFGVTALLWYGGFVKEFTCTRVVEDSQIWRTFECGVAQKETGEGEFKYKEIENRGDVRVSDIEEVVTQVFSEASPGVVGIGVRGEDLNQDQIIGTGFLVTENGLIVTNRHVVESEELTYFVNLKDSQEALEVVEIYRDPVNDIALIRIEGEDYTALPLGDSNNLQQGQTVIAIGNPLGRYSGTVTSGIISGLNREVRISEGFFASGAETYDDVIQTDAAINPGNSGGPLLNSNGEVIGVNFATVSGADNLSFAIPINRVKSRIAELNQYGQFKVPFVGIEYRLRIILVEGESTVGAQVLSVIQNSPAAKAGLKRGDIILEFNGTSLEDVNLLSLIQRTEIGQEVDVVILRNGQQLDAVIKIGQRSDFSE